ncbi:MAG: gliding motility-associated C-terminal domain-containing protein [Bacteroidota bacterium]|nr:gliding motility-associated C-terminal domain-containing protein [Bacteroidota bacterium]
MITSPVVNCVSVLPNGDVTINWSQPADPLSEFASYNIFSSTTTNIAGPYSSIGTINTYATTSFTVSGAGANTVPKFYYITTTSSGGTTEPATDTVRTIFLVLTNPGNGVAYLQWNPIADPLHPSSSVSYSVYREYPTGTFTPLGTTTDNKWRDTINICSYFFNYRVEILDANFCTSVSNVAGGTLSDQTFPNTPTIDSVSVNNTSGQTVIGLTPSTSSDATCYVVYKKNGFSYIAIDTVCGNTPTVYPIASSSPDTGTESYGIASVDSCGNISPISVNQNTMFLIYDYHLCEKEVLLGWNPYLHMQNGLKEYKVYMSVNGSAYSIVGDTTGLAFLQTGLTQNKTYRFFIRAFDSTGTVTSTSNIITFFTKTQPQPTYVYVKSVSVNEEQNIVISVQVDTSEFFRGVEVYRALASGGPYSLLGYLGYNGGPSYSITDANAETASTVYYYKATVIDSCNLASITSNVSKSIVLTISSNTNRTNTLTWTDYQSYLGNVSSYKIFRSIDDVFEPNPIVTVSSGVHSFIDNIEEFVPNSGRFDYYVQAVEGPGNPYLLQELSNSNIVKTYHTDSVFIPNAFSPKGINRIWLPVTQYVEKTEYKVSIFDRWGQKIWQTELDTEGWDGGSFEAGLYAYVVEYKNAFGEYKHITGTVMMIK